MTEKIEFYRELLHIDPTSKVFYPLAVLLFEARHLDATVRGTGQRVVEVDEVHIWHFDANGKVIRFRHRADTHLHWMVYNASS